MGDQPHYKPPLHNKNLRSILTKWRESNFETALNEQKSFLSSLSPWPSDINKEALTTLLNFDIIPYAFDSNRVAKDENGIIRVKTYLCLIICGKERAEKLAAGVQRVPRAQINIFDLDGGQLGGFLGLSSRDDRCVGQSCVPREAWKPVYWLDVPKTDKNFDELKRDDPWFIDLRGSDWDTNIDFARVVLGEAQDIRKTETSKQGSEAESLTFTFVPES